MSQNEDMTELTYLEKVGKDRWKFQIKFNASFAAIFQTLAKSHAFEAKTVQWPKEEEYHLIDDQGIWLLSHCFSNWTEFYQKATKKSPWEEAWQKRAEQGEPEPEKKHCAQCGHFIGKYYDLCGTCHKPVCSTCHDIHQQTHKAKCEHCQKFWYRDVLEECPECSKLICVLCGPEHKANHLLYTYSARTEYGMPGDMNAETLQRIIDEMKKSYEWSQAQAKAKEEEATRSRAKEQEERMKEQARKNEEFWHGFFYQHNPFGSQSAGDDDSYTFRQHYTGQQSYSNGYYGFDKQSTPGISKDLHDAFNALGISTRATVQEVKHAFRRQAKKVHPDVGGSEQAFKALNAAYQLALSHAEKNEVK